LQINRDSKVKLAQQKYPNLIANIGNAGSWLKALIGKL